MSRWTDADVAAALARMQGTCRVPRPLTAAPALRESTFQDHLRTLATRLGYLYYHTRNSKGSDIGWLDTVIAHPDGGALHVIELKVGDNQPSPAQRRWIEALQKVTHVDARVCWPGDWPAIVELLTRRTA